MLRYNGKDFTTGLARFISSLPGHIGETPKIFVKIIPAPLQPEVYAEVDTGTPWLILDPEIVDAIGLVRAQGEPARLRTFDGMKNGHLERTTITLVAEEGESVEVDATAFVCEDDWPQGMNFLGYTGLLERIRFAVDSATNSFFFGPADPPL